MKNFHIVKRFTAAASFISTIFKLSSLFVVHSVQAQTFDGITNPSLSEEFGQKPAAANSGVTFVLYFLYLWNVAMVIGGLIVLFFFIQAGIEWITAGGDSAKIQKARDRMIQSVIGLFILVFSFVIVGFINQLAFAPTGFNLFKLSLPDVQPTVPDVP